MRRNDADHVCQKVFVRLSSDKPISTSNDGAPGTPELASLSTEVIDSNKRAVHRLLDSMLVANTSLSAAKATRFGCDDKGMTGKSTELLPMTVAAPSRVQPFP